MKDLEEEENVSASAKKKKDDDDIKKLLNADLKPIHHNRSLLKRAVNDKNPRVSIQFAFFSLTISNSHFYTVVF